MPHGATHTKRKEMVNMKRLITLILAAALALSLTACGSSTPTKDEMLENAQEVDFKEYAIQYAENSATLKEQYGGQTCTISGYVTNIRGDINEVQLEWHDGTAYYTEEEQARLTDNSMVLDASNYILFCDIAEDGGITEIKNGDYISVVGQFDENGRQLENAYIILE